MSDFYKRFLVEDARKMGAASGRQLFLAAFGKHPGWDDHVEDLGLESESLVYVKSRLYVQGIGGQIDSGAWEKLDESQRLGLFKHVLLWQRGNQVIIGRMWSSSDGKGRTRYPLIVCAHCLGVPVESALAQVLPRLEQIEQACLSTHAAADVRSLLDRHRSELRTALATANNSSDSPITSAMVADFVNHSALGPDKEGWYRILHQMQSQMALFAPGKFSLKGDLNSLRPQQVRVPACAPSPLQTFVLWSRFFQTQVDGAVPLLFTLPLEESWVDVTVGEPTPLEVFALRASPRSIPLASEVPYNLEPAFRERARAQVAAFAGDTAMKPRGREDAPAVTTQTPPGGKLKLLRWLGGGAAVLAVAGLALALTFGNRGGSKQLTAAPPATGSPTDAEKAEAQARLQQQTAAAEAQRLSDARAKADAEAKARAEEVRIAMARAEQRRKADAEARAQTEAEAKAKLEAETKARMEAEAKARADETARQLAMAAEAEKRRRADAEALAKAELEAKARQANTVSPVIASVAPPVVEPKPVAASPGRYITNRVGLELISLTGDLWVGKYEVTQGEYVKVMGKNPSKVTGNPRLPVESVSWEDAKKFCEKLNEMEKAYLPPGFAYDLPTQQQWELLAGDAAFDDAVTSQGGNRSAPALVGTLSANNHGLHDVLGNVWEWCLDGPSSQEKALRGGAFNNQKTFRFKPLTTRTVHKLAPVEKSHDVGFRCVMARMP